MAREWRRRQARAARRGGGGQRGASQERGGGSGPQIPMRSSRGPLKAPSTPQPPSSASPAIQPQSHPQSPIISPNHQIQPTQSTQPSQSQITNQHNLTNHQSHPSISPTNLHVPTDPARPALKSSPSHAIEASAAPPLVQGREKSRV